MKSFFRQYPLCIITILGFTTSFLSPISNPKGLLFISPFRPFPFFLYIFSFSFKVS